MMGREQNERLCRVGPGTACGKMMRRYWQPAALAEELAGSRPLVPVRLLGEDFVLFRNESGRLGMLDRDCPHRGADLAFGRLENGGLRCVFHGWLFDTEGRCLEMPAEPAGSTFCQRLRQKSYPVMERNGVIFAYLGEGTPPTLPAFDCFVADDAYTFAFKGLWECNWLQALEVGIDPAHASYLHRFFEDETSGETYGKQFRDMSTDSDIPMTKVLREHDRPEIRVETSDVGLRLIALRQLTDTQMHVRVTNCVFPHIINLPLSTDMVLTQFHVPVDDDNMYWYSMFTSFTTPVDKAEMRAQRIKVIEPPHYRSKLNRSNNYGYDPEEQRTKTYTGMGHDINVHDQFAVESQGRVQNRMREHLGQSDRAISLYRRLLARQIDAVEKGEQAIATFDAVTASGITGPVTIDGVAPTADWENYYQRAYRKKRQNAAWS
jgi:phenylpropionate dioxygenase-like ring-hydroxylating dioxygenase large terminal subunit